MAVRPLDSAPMPSAASAVFLAVFGQPPDVGLPIRHTLLVLRRSGAQRSGQWLWRGLSRIPRRWRPGGRCLASVAARRALCVFERNVLCHIVVGNGDVQVAQDAVAASHFPLIRNHHDAFSRAPSTLLGQELAGYAAAEEDALAHCFVLEFHCVRRDRYSRRGLWSSRRPQSRRSYRRSRRCRPGE